MAMGGLDKDDYSAPLAEINMTPLVDVMLVLLVIFLVTAPMLTQAVKLDLPNENAARITDENPVVLSITAKGAYYWSDAAIMLEEIEARFEGIAAHNPNQPIHLRADENVAYGKVSAVLAMAQRQGLSNIGFITEKAH